jgi:8-oxo-dGTP diphosphatase
MARQWGAHGVHLSAKRLRNIECRPGGAGFLIAASCHDAAELARAKTIGVDFVVLSPLRSTPSHPGHPALGWRRFEELTLSAGLPVYALGGVKPDDLEAVRAAGGFGVAGISAFW